MITNFHKEKLGEYATARKLSYFITIHILQNTYNINHRKFTKNIASSIVLSQKAKNDIVFLTFDPVASINV